MGASGEGLTSALPKPANSTAVAAPAAESSTAKRSMSGAAISLNVHAGPSLPAPAPTPSVQSASSGPIRLSYAAAAGATRAGSAPAAGLELSNIGPAPEGELPDASSEEASVAASATVTPPSSPPRGPAGGAFMPATPNLSQERLSSREASNGSPPPLSPTVLPGKPAAASSDAGEATKKAVEAALARPLTAPGTVRRQVRQVTPAEDIKGLAEGVESMLRVFRSLKGRLPTDDEAASISCKGEVPSLEERLELDSRRLEGKKGRAVLGCTGALTLHWCGTCQRWMRCGGTPGNLTFSCACPEGTIPCTGRLVGDEPPPSIEPATSGRTSERADSGTHLFCETCNVSATSDAQLAAHLGGKNHKRHTSLAELSSRGAVTPAGQAGDATLFCDICDVKAPSAHHKEYHIRGQRHQRKEKQQALLENAEMVSSNTIAAVLSEFDDAVHPPNPTAESAAASVPTALETASSAAEATESGIAPADGGAETSAGTSTNAGVASADSAGASAETGVPSSETGAATSEPGVTSAETCITPGGEGASPPEAEGVASPKSAASDSSGGRVRPYLTPLIVPTKFKPGPISPFAEDSQQQMTHSSSEETVGVSPASPRPNFAADAYGDAVAALPRSRSGRIARAADDGAESTPHYRAVESIPEGVPGTLASSGGSISIAAAHFCPICGIIATSEANLEDHLTGRRHARRLAFIANMPEKDRNATLVRAASGYISDIANLTHTNSGNVYDNFPCVRVGEFTLPSSMDLRKHLEDIQIWGSFSLNDSPAADPRTPGSARPTSRLARTFTAAQAAADSLVRTATAMVAAAKDGDTLASGNGVELDSQGSSRSQLQLPSGPAGGSMRRKGEAQGEEDAEDEEGDGVTGGGNRRHQCITCGITTTSASHLEAHLLGRKHRRRVDVANGKGIKPSQHYCRLCDITTTSADHMVMHVNGKAHKRRVATGNVPGTAAGIDIDSANLTSLDVQQPATDVPLWVPEEQYECKECSITAGSAEDFQNHLHGMAHRNWSRPRTAQPQRYSPPEGGRPPTADGVGAHRMGPAPVPMYMPAPPQYPGAPMPHPAYGYYPHAYYSQAPGPGSMQPVWWGAPPGAYQTANPSYMGYGPMAPPMDMSHFARQGSWGSHMGPPVMMHAPAHDMTTYHCEICGITMAALEQYTAHLRSRQHVRLSKKQQQAGKSGDA